MRHVTAFGREPSIQTQRGHPALRPTHKMPAPAQEVHAHSAGPFAENSAGNLVHATTARKKDAHSCQNCAQKVFPRQGRVNLHHFAHCAGNVVKCSGYSGGETVEHLEAKWFLAWHLDDFRFVMQSCDMCGAPNKQNCVAFSTTAWNVDVEGKVPGTGTSRARRADILLWRGAAAAAAVPGTLKTRYALEVRHSHAVSADKTRELRSVGCGVVEVSASAVLACRQKRGLSTCPTSTPTALSPGPAMGACRHLPRHALRSGKRMRSGTLPCGPTGRSFKPGMRV